jgi:hypothetical protein
MQTLSKSSVVNNQSELMVCDFTGKFSDKTKALLMELSISYQFITTGLVYQLLVEDVGKVRIILDGPKERLEEVGFFNREVIVRPHAFRSVEKDGTNGRTPMLIRSIIVPTGGGYGMKFKYNSERKVIVVC